MTLNWGEPEILNKDLPTPRADTYDPPRETAYPSSIDQTCCGKCSGATCYVDYLTGERS